MSPSKKSKSRISLIGILSIFLVMGGIIFSIGAFGSDIGPMIRQLFWTGGSPLGWGQFETTTGNAGKFSLDIAPSNSVDYPEATIVGGYMTGYFWIDTIGWTRFNNTAVVAPGTGLNARKTWTISGYAWNDNAGWIDMNDMEYIPDTLVLSGYAWNPWIGWMNLSRSGPVQQNVANVGTGFIGKVKILGNIGGNSVYSTTYAIDPNFQNLSFNKAINIIRKNVALATRNITPWAGQSIIWDPPIIVDQKIIYRNTDATPVRYSDIESSLGVNALKDVRSLIVIGGDIYVDTGVTLANDGPRVIIALANDRGERWDIYIRWRVTKIYSTLVAEWSIKSAYVPPTPPWWAPYIYNDNKQSIISGLPPYQLYVNGSIFANNTIWGSANDIELRCPIVEPNCTYDTAVRYDFNYFRDFQIIDAAHRGYKDTRYDDYSMVIEYDSRINANPPPGLENISQ
jgi:hypothetical protein